jgi:hypothetical protein
MRYIPPFGDGPNVINVTEDMMPEWAPGKRCIMPIEFQPGQRLYVARAAMASGKSHAINAYISQLRRDII